MAETIEKLSHIDHIIKRPDSYVGPTSLTNELCWILKDEKFVKENVRYSPALLKIFDEILVNAIDRNSLYPTDVKNISVELSLEDNSICIENDGPLGGICVKEHEKEKLWNPELTFGHLLTSTNYDDDKKRVVGGRNGYGAKLTNIYSKNFEIHIYDSENQKHYHQIWNNNMKDVSKPKITKYSGKSSKVSIKFCPDWSLFGMSKMDIGIYKIFEKRVFDANLCTSTKCKIKFQGEVMKKMDIEGYAKMYLPDQNMHSATCGRWSVCIAPSDGSFDQVSFVNGICTTKGGTHVDYIANIVASGIIEDLSKKIKLKPAQVKSTFMVFVKCTLENPSFSSQVKSECTLKPCDFGSAFIIPKTFIKSILKTGIQDEVLSLSKFKEQKELKKTDGARKSKITGIPKLDDANFAGSAKSSNCTLIITEGDSAKTLAVAGLSVVGRDYYGVFPLRGKCKNVREASVKQLMSNQEFNDLKKILGLQQDKIYENLNELRYGRLMIMTDADNDGSHIKGLVLNMIHYFWPSLLDLGFVVSMITPIIKASKGSKVETFFTESSFREWYDGGKPGWKIKYYKGLGTSTSVEAKQYFGNIKQLTVSFNVDDKTDESVILAFDKTKADSRKKWLLESTEKKSNELEVPYGKINNLGISEFIHRDLVNFSLADLKRSIAHMCDGLKPSQRKVMYACFTKNLKEEMKVAQLAAYVSEKTSYHHGEVSLADTIVKIAHDFTGSNNINLLEPCGQFGTRLMGGKDASQTRYIFTKLSSDARKIFDQRDDDILNYLDDDGKKIEPEFYVPVLPMVLINGTEGIGTGFSCYVPPFNPKDIIENISNFVNGKPLKPMIPWFKGYTGNVEKTDDKTYTFNGVYKTTSKYIEISELPPTRWTQDYKEYLDELCEKKLISSYVNKSTTEKVLFEIYGYTGSSLIKDFKLQKVFHTTNMHLFHPTKGIKKYSSPEEILVDFLEVRLEYYKKRKNNIIKNLKEKSSQASEKARFVNMVVNEDLIIFKKSKSNIEKQIESNNFKKFDNSWDYLLNIKTYQYSIEAIEELNKEAQRLSEELSTISKLSIIDIYKNDLLSYNV